MSEHCDKCAELADRYRQENQRLRSVLPHLELAKHKIEQTFAEQYKEGQALRVAYEAVRDAAALLREKGE